MYLASLGRLACAAICCCAAATATAAPKGAYEYIVLDGSGLKWGPSLAGTPATVTYAIVSTRHRFPGARNCPDIIAPNALLAASHVSRARFDEAVKAAFGAWSAVASIRFEPTDAEHADILVGAQTRPRGRAFTNVDYGAADPSADDIRALRRAVICLSPAHKWKTTLDGDLEVYDLRYTLTHEIGHAIGLDHFEGQLMDYRYQEERVVLQPGDIEGAARLYGPSSAHDVIADRLKRPVSERESSMALDAAVAPGARPHE